jgi:hypothetical protein
MNFLILKKCPAGSYEREIQLHHPQPSQISWDYSFKFWTQVSCFHIFVVQKLNISLDKS